MWYNVEQCGTMWNVRCDTTFAWQVACAIHIAFHIAMHNVHMFSRGCVWRLTSRGRAEAASTRPTFASRTSCCSSCNTGTLTPPPPQ